jgi:hypothetical protein
VFRLPECFPSRCNPDQEAYFRRSPSMVGNSTVPFTCGALLFRLTFLQVATLVPESNYDTFWLPIPFQPLTMPLHDARLR